MEAKVQMIHILHHQTDQIVGWVTRVKTDSHQNTITNEETYDFTLSVNEMGADEITSRSRILIPGEEGDFREFIVDYIYENTATMEKQVYSKGSFVDIRKSKIISPQVLDAQTIQTAAGLVLSGLEWEVGIVDYSGIRKWIIERHLDAFDALKSIASLFECEMRFRVTTDGDTITGRYVDFIKRQGLNRGKEITFGKDLIGITRKVLGDRIVTALHCLGPERQDGTRLEAVVTNDAAFQNWNRKGKHLIELYEPESTDENMTLERLKQLGEAELQKRITAAVEYEVDAANLEHIFGYEHEIVRLGDGDRIKDEHFNPPMYLESRVVFVDRSIFNKAKKTFKLGEVIEYKKEDIMKTWRELQDLYATKIIKSPTAPPGKPNIIWIKTGGSVEVAHTWDSILNKWIPLNGRVTWFMYADDANGLNMSPDSTGKNYIGIAYNQTEETPSMDPADYTWSLFRGPQGVPGPTGENGQPTFTWIKYADDSSGNGLSDNPTGKKYIGIAQNKLVQEESNNPADYTWALIQGPKGDTGAQGPQGSPAISYNWVKSANIIIDPQGNIRKSGGTTGWNEQAYTKESFINGAFLSFKPGDKVTNYMFGLNTDPETDANYPSMDYVFYMNSGNLFVFENGSNVQSCGPYNAGDSLQITYDGANVRYYHNGELKRTKTVAANLKLFVDSSFSSASSGNQVTDIFFGPMGSKGDKGETGSTGPTGPEGPQGPTGPGARNFFIDSYLRRFQPYANTGHVNTPGEPTNSVRANYLNNGGTTFGLYHHANDRYMEIVAGEKYALTFEVRGNVTKFDYCYFMRSDGTNNAFPTVNVTLSETEYTKVTLLGTGPWSSAQAYILIGSRDVAAGKWFEIKKPRLNINADTGWAPSMEDINSDIKNAQVSADGKNKIYRQDSSPPTTGNKIGDLWFETDNGNKMHVWTGTVWAETKLDYQALSVGKLSAISADLGNVTAGDIRGVTLDLGNGKLIVDENGNVTFKGDLTGASGTFSGKISTTGTKGTVTIENDTIKSEKDGWYVQMSGSQLEAFIGALTSAKINGNGLFLNNLNKDQKGGSVSAGNTNGVTHVDVFADNYLRLLAYGAEKARLIETGLSMIGDNIISTIDRGWIAPTLLNGVTNYGSVYETAGYKKDALGDVPLKGFLTGSADGKHLFTLPVGFRPSKLKTIEVWSNSPSGNGRVTVDTDGKVIATISGNWISLDGKIIHL